MESVHKMHNIKDERETVSVLCHRGNLTAANGQIPVYLGSLKPFSHGVSTMNTTVCTRRYIMNYRTVSDC